MSISIGVGSFTILSKCTLLIYEDKLYLIYPFEDYYMWILMQTSGHITEKMRVGNCEVV